MKTLLINASPKKRGGASSYFLGLARFFISGDKETERLRGKGDHQRILQKLPGADTVIFFLPLYVDSAPSHVLAFLREMEGFCLDNDVRLHIYCVANNGFIEGRQNQPLMQLFQNFCAKSRLDWRGGLGIGGGVMLNVTRILFLVNAAVLLLSMALSGLAGGAFLPPDALRSFAVNTLLLLFLNAGALFHIFSMSRAVSRGGNRPFGERYTRIMLPSFVFILFADAFFAVISLFSGGIFRGWLAGKKL